MTFHLDTKHNQESNTNKRWDTLFDFVTLVDNKEKGLVNQLILMSWETHKNVNCQDPINPEFLHPHSPNLIGHKRKAALK